MARLIVRPATPEDIQDISRRLRRSDQEEIRAIADISPLEAVAASAATSAETLVMDLGGKVICIGGVTPVDAAIGTGAYVWQLGSPEIDANMVAFYRESRTLRDRWLRQYGLLQNWVYAGNTVSIRYLRRLGYSLADMPMPFGAYGLPFYYFFIRGDRCVC